MALWSLAPKPAPKLVDGAVVLIGEASVRFKVNSRARRVSLRVDMSKGEVVATAPNARRLADALRFAESRRDWIAAQLRRMPTVQVLAPDVILQVDGAPCRFERAAMRMKARFIPHTDIEPARLLAFGEDQAYARAAVRALKARALERLMARTRVHVLALGHPMPDVMVMDARMRWGSCKQGRGSEPAHIRYNWRLILAPPWVLDYVAAHEAAHLVEANHSLAYWAVVNRIFGDHRPARAWLRKHGGALHAIGG